MNRFAPLQIKRKQTTDELTAYVEQMRAANPKRLEIDFPWPPSILKPNGGHGHWAPKAKAAKAYKVVCSAVCWQSGLHIKKHSLVKDGLALRVTYTFNPPDNRRRDKDNCIASIKALQDAIATVLGVDDNHFVTTYAMGENGAGNVSVLIEAATSK